MFRVGSAELQPHVILLGSDVIAALRSQMRSGGLNPGGAGRRGEKGEMQVTPFHHAEQNHGQMGSAQQKREGCRTAG